MASWMLPRDTISSHTHVGSPSCTHTTCAFQGVTGVVVGVAGRGRQK
jgi:hypothetical protein